MLRILEDSSWVATSFNSSRAKHSKQLVQLQLRIKLEVIPKRAKTQPAVATTAKKLSTSAQKLKETRKVSQVSRLKPMPKINRRKCRLTIYHSPRTWLSSQVHCLRRPLWKLMTPRWLLETHSTSDAFIYVTIWTWASRVSFIKLSKWPRVVKLAQINTNSP